MFENKPIGSHSDNNQDDKWQKDVINRLAFAAINEQKRTRRWGIFFKSLIFVYLFMIFMLAYMPHQEGSSNITLGKHTALIQLNGVISSDSEASADTIITGLRNAFEDEDTVGIILRINSPGGSPVQAGYINDEIYRLREKYPETKLYAVITDMCASGGYYIAAAADAIYADKGSVVGSIGVIMNGFGFVDSMKKLGVERRLYTSGKHKAFLDPFSKENPEEVKHIQTVLKDIHKQFIEIVKKGRGDKLKNDPNLFSGYVWTGEQSIDMGLVDALGSSSYVAREIIKAEKIVDFTPKPNYLDRFAERFGVAMAKTVTQVLGMNEGSIR
ncbi:Periplasmic serine proteases (ClpP class) [hydrothermal vent metagenome]|uniref:Periplasmic serine proteases (ClpP class) n=1 Tax=hydrothermal vent metagenome TaxID=652676 RepID=A0A3B1ANK3_9ZZZZ